MLRNSNVIKLHSREFLKHPEDSIFQDGYGQIPKLIMCDPGLTIEAKAIYAYLASYAGGGNQAFPAVSKICTDLHIDKKRFYRHFQMVLDAGYIKKAQTIDEENKFKNNVYEFNYKIPKKKAKSINN